MRTVRLIAGLLGAALLCGVAPSEGPSDKVDTRIGVKIGNGTTMPGPCRPYASVYPSPDSVWPRAGRRFAPPNGIWLGDPVSGFSQLHAQGTGGTPSYGLFLVSPTLAKGFSEREIAAPMTMDETHPYRFRCRLGDIGVALVPTAHGALYTFDFPPTNGARLVVNALRKIGLARASTNAWIAVDAAKGTLRGGGTYAGNWNPNPYEAYFAARVDRPFAVEPAPEPGLAGVRFPATDGLRVTLRIAVSFLSADKAEEYLVRELDGRSSDEIAAEARAEWNRELSAIVPEGLPAAEERQFYAQFFHTFVQPRNRDGDFGGPLAGAVVRDDHHTLWDTWRTLFPLMAIVRPDEYAANLNAISARARAFGDCTVAFVQGREFRTGQGGDDVDNVIADAFAKDIPGLTDREGLWLALADHAAHRVKEYREIGYVVSDRPNDYCWRMKSGSGTLAFAYNDWCAAQVARALGKTDEAARLEARSGNWTNVWDATAVDGPSGYAGFVRGRRADGTFGVPVKGRPGVFAATDPRAGYNTDFYEGTCWIYSYGVPHAIPELVARMGGAETFAARLEYALAHGLIDIGNEPSFLTVWLFDFVGRSDRCAYWADRLRRRFPASGTPGDDDAGAMGSLYVFLTAGFFPVAGQDLYALHGPAASKVTFNLPNGRVFTVRSEGYRRGEPFRATLNGRPLARPFLRHRDIVAGGELVFSPKAGEIGSLSLQLHEDPTSRLKMVGCRADAFTYYLRKKGQ